MNIDPITLEVIRGRLECIAQEMLVGIVRSAYSSVIKEAEDASTAIFDLDGQKIAEARAIPIHLGTLVSAVQHVLDVFPPQRIREGDLYILNDPYVGGTHLPDMILIMPVFWRAKPVALSCTVAHHRDIGGKTPASTPTDATEIFQEGLRIPALKLHEAGRPNESLLSLIRHNVRLPDDFLGDLDAQVAACHMGARALQDLWDEYGEQQLGACIVELLNRSERLTRAKLQEIPDGTYSFTDYLDNDGVDLESRVRMQVAVTVKNGNVAVDFEGTSAQVRGPLNAPFSTAYSAVYFVVRAITDPSIPSNAGCTRPVHLRLPEGSLVNPRPPAPVNARMPTYNLMIDVLLGAFAQAIPGKIPAASYDSFTTAFGGVDPVTARPYVFSDIGAGGLGARPTKDGIEVFRGKGGNTLNTPVETIEMDFPVRVLRYALRQDSGGPGRYRGGLGYEKVFELLRGEMTVSHRGERYCRAPWGLDGGIPGAPSRAVIVRRAGQHEAIRSKRVFTMEAGDQLHLFSAGGGGFGNPLERSPDAVRTDVLDNKVSIEAAAEQYGMVADRLTNELDAEATSACGQDLPKQSGH